MAARTLALLCLAACTSALGTTWLYEEDSLGKGDSGLPALRYTGALTFPNGTVCALFGFDDLYFNGKWC